MKTQQINWFYIMVFFCIFSIMLLGCDRTNSGVGDETFYSKLYEDSTYLAFDGNIFDPLVIWDHMDIYSLAYERIRKCLKFKDNQLQWNIQNGEEIKISENIFEYITMMWNYDNELLKSGEYELKLDDTYYEIIPKESPMLSRAPSRKYILKMNDKQSLFSCYDIYRDFYPGDCICDWVALNVNFKPDNYGGAYVNGFIDIPKEESTVFKIYQKGIYFVANTCVNVKEYRCELNYCRTHSANEYIDDKKNKVIVLMKKNGQHAPILTVQLTYR